MQKLQNSLTVSITIILQDFKMRLCPTVDRHWIPEVGQRSETQQWTAVRIPRLDHIWKPNSGQQSESRGWTSVGKQPPNNKGSGCISTVYTLWDPPVGPQSESRGCTAVGNPTVDSSRNPEVGPQSEINLLTTREVVAFPQCIHCGIPLLDRSRNPEVVPQLETQQWTAVGIPRLVISRKTTS